MSFLRFRYESGEAATPPPSKYINQLLDLDFETMNVAC